MKKSKKYKLSRKDIQDLNYWKNRLIESEKKIDTKEINTCKAMINKYLDEIINK